MSGATLVLDPQFEALLREAAAKPGSVLLTHERPKRLTSPFSSDSPVRASLPGLSSAEKELLRVHRVETAQLLRDLSLRALWDGPSYRGAFTRYIDIERSIGEPSREDLRRRIEDLRRGRDPQVQESLGEGGLDGTDREKLERMSAYELAAISYRFEPRTQAIVLAALDLAQNGPIEISLPLFRRALREPVCDRERASAYDGIAHHHSRQGDTRAAIRAGQMACLTDASYAVSRLNLLCLALQVGDGSIARSAAQELEHSLSSEHPLLDDYLARVHTQRVNGTWSPSATSFLLARELADDLGPIGRKVALVLLEE